VDFVSKALLNIGHEVVPVALSLNLEQAIVTLKKLRPAVVFNLVESIAGVEKFMHFAPTLLDHLKLQYTGGNAHALYITTNKLYAKEILCSADLPTPCWFSMRDTTNNNVSFDPPYIIKPVCEDASVGVDEQSIVYNRKAINDVLRDRSTRFGECFAEAYIPGREFNLSVLANSTGPEVLPPAEIRFVDFPKDKPQIVGYTAKWDEESFEYQHTVRSFDYPPEDRYLLTKLSDIALRCWQTFELRGYARVDFRVDDCGNIWILEINVNPCISPDSGFVAATQQAGLSFEQVVTRILHDSLKSQII